ncbi:MAG: sterol desaturase family protein [Chitinophagaceae bacterium]|nr:sterol desaturase family protein [Bacteroidota bacterium]MCC6258364.1 sterol desaturase family protein [Chitinophagaceae bacterium]
MKFDKIHNKGQARIFKNHYLEYLTKTHPLVIWGMYTPVFVLLPYYSGNKLGMSGLNVALIFFSGIFFWTFTEYMLHRFAFHYDAGSPTGRRISYIMHGNHHEFPRDRQRLFMPPVPSLIMASLIFLLMYLVLGKYVFPFFPGFMFGYLLYGSMHYAIHAWNPPFKWMKALWRNHHLHHYKDEKKGFGVSSTLWDHVFGTGFDLKKEVEDKQKVQALMFTKKH